jgi:hypothetical protein
MIYENLINGKYEKMTDVFFKYPTNELTNISTFGELTNIVYPCNESSNITIKESSKVNRKEVVVNTCKCCGIQFEVKALPCLACYKYLCKKCKTPVKDIQECKECNEFYSIYRHYKCDIHPDRCQFRRWEYCCILNDKDNCKICGRLVQYPTRKNIHVYK